MKVKRNLFLASLCVLFLVCYYIMNQTYDELARYPYATEENHDLILHYLDEKDIDFLLAQNVKPEQFLPYVECAGFQLEHTLWYDKAMLAAGRRFLYRAVYRNLEERIYIS